MTLSSLIGGWQIICGCLGIISLFASTPLYLMSPDSSTGDFLGLAFVLIASFTAILVGWRLRSRSRSAIVVSMILWWLQIFELDSSTLFYKCFIGLSWSLGMNGDAQFIDGFGFGGKVAIELMPAATISSLAINIVAALCCAGLVAEYQKINKRESSDIKAA